MDETVLFLSRLKFAFTVGYHIIFPAMTIGLALYLFVVEILWIRTKNPDYSKIYRLISHIFALGFGMGVVTGITMAFQFGTNWGPFAIATSNVLGGLIGYEVLTAFFLEATFLGIVLFGWGKVSPHVHLFATAMVALGTTLSAFWIMVVNAWMQNPVGTEYIEGIFYVKSWTEVIFNPKMFYHFTHMLIAAYLTGMFVIMGIMAVYLLKDNYKSTALKGFKVALAMVVILAPAQLILGDLHGKFTAESQPIKIAAMEGLWETQKGAPAVLFAIPDEKNEENRMEIKIPKLASWYLKGDVDSEIQGMKSVAKEDRPPVKLVFYSFRIMVGIGLLMILLAVWGTWLWWRNSITESRLYLRLMTLTIPLGFIATIAGWIVTEVGRQPWVVQGYLRTAESVTKTLTASAVQMALAGYVLVYLVLLIAFLCYAVKTVRHGMAHEMSVKE